MSGEQIEIDGSSLTQWRETRHSHSYPSLLSHYNLHQFEASIRGLPSDAFSTVESDGGRKLVHIWQWEEGSRSRSSCAFQDLASVWI